MDQELELKVVFVNAFVSGTGVVSPVVGLCRVESVPLLHESSIKKTGARTARNKRFIYNNLSVYCEESRVSNRVSQKETVM